jgi:hypothetical protein
VGHGFATVFASPVQKRRIFKLVFLIITATVTEIITTKRIYSKMAWPVLFRSTIASSYHEPELPIGSKIDQKMSQYARPDFPGIPP